MFEKITPEQAGISSKVVTKFINKLLKRGTCTHGFLFMRGDKIFAEGYYKPFHKDYNHRMYSQTKSFVAVAIGLLIEEGKLSLDDVVADYFPEKIDDKAPKYIDKQTLREMLTMVTGGWPTYWFLVDDPDRTHLYFSEQRKTHPSGTIWEYDSAGSQVLCALVEKVANKSLLSYLKEKLFDKMGTFKNAEVLKCPNGDSWGDSAMICTLRDMASFGRLVMNYGTYNGERLVSEEYLKEATSKLVDNRGSGHYCSYYQGYGYQIWRISGNGFAFIGMGNQLTFMYPDKDLMFVCMSDDQGDEPRVREMLVTTVEEMFVDEIKDYALPEDKDSEKELEELINSLELVSLKGPTNVPFEKEINGVKYVCEENPMGITEFTFNFNGDKGEFLYVNKQGRKVIPFGINHNEFSQFPEFGYANEYGNVKTTDGFTYKCATSFAWREDKKFTIFTQIIDKYLANMTATFAFKGDEVHAKFVSAAECFLNEYRGYLNGKKA